MFQKNLIFCTIPARGGSKGLPGKNVKKLNGKPLIAYAILAARKSRYVDRVFVSTDDKKIAAAAKRYGAEVVIRPSALAKDSTPTLPAVLHLLKHVKRAEGVQPDVHVLVQPTSPFVTGRDVDSSIETMMRTKTDGCVSVCAAQERPEHMFTIADNGKAEPLISGSLAKRRQNLPTYYLLNGAVFVTRTRALPRGIIQRNTSAYVMPAGRSVDIDDQNDFSLAESLMKKKETRMKKGMRIGKKRVGDEAPVFIVAEIGVNHNGSVALAKKLIDAANRAGADAVKLQMCDPDEMVVKNAPKAAYQEKTAKGESHYRMLKRLYFGTREHTILKAYAKKKGIILFSTPFSIADARRLIALKMPAMKVGSSDTNNIPQLQVMARAKVPMLLSTGMSDLTEVRRAVGAIRAAGNDQIVVLQCTTQYPAEDANANLRAMGTMARALRVPVGFSDHTVGIEIAFAAVALGACVVEKHLTLDRTLPGPDHFASLEPKEFAALVKGIRRIEKALGSGRKTITSAEKVIARVARKSIVAARPISKGAKIAERDLAYKRPGTGKPPSFSARILGKRAPKNYAKDEQL